MRPIVGITMGDPAGIGPEIVVKALAKREIQEVCRPIVIGDRGLLRLTADRCKVDINVNVVKAPFEHGAALGSMDVIDLRNVNLASLRVGQVSKEAGRASIEYVQEAVKYALTGNLDAIVTAPINKESIHLAGCPHIGNTELIGALTGSRKPVTMFLVQGVRIFFLTRHLPLLKAVKAVKRERIVESVIRIGELLSKIGVDEPEIAVVALNPHGGDGGLIGSEEIDEIVPAVEELVDKGVNALGPIPADSVFHSAFRGRYDAVLSLYHDQGHIASKTMDFYGTVSVTLGLPFIRTSVDHGTAFDIAGKGVAESRSLEEAIKVASDLSLNPHALN